MNRWEDSNEITCGGKKSFHTWKQARTFENRIRKPGSALKLKGKKLEKLHPYICRKCGFIHLGHAARKRPGTY